MFLNTVNNYIPQYNNIPQPNRKIILFCIDGLLFIFCLIFALTTFYGLQKSLQVYCIFFPLFTTYIALKLLIFKFSKLYRSITKFTDLRLISKLIKSIFISTLVGLLLVFIFASEDIAESVIFVDGMASIITILSLRISLYSLIKSLAISSPVLSPKSKLVIYGAGSAGYQLAKNLEYNSDYQVVAFVDDNPELEGRLLSGISIHRPQYLFSLHQQEPFDTLIFAIPSLTTLRRREIIEQLESLPINFKTIPDLKELLSNKTKISQLNSIDTTSLLGRKEVSPQENLLKINITNKTVLVTGAGGSIGSELCRQVIQLKPKCLILFELSEFALYTIDLELRKTDFDIPIYTYLGSVTDEIYFQSILVKHNVETIYHAAAYKHVPILEINPCVGIYNNVYGTLITARSAMVCGVKNYVLISTDKAVRPTNVMGASKRVAELIIQSLVAQKNVKTIFAIVRFGNVLNSSGSVVPRFRQQISEGQPITLTHKEVTRYFISISEAVNLVIQAGAMAKGGEIFLLDMGNPIRIYDLATKMIRLSGMIPEKDIPIKIIGLRPGEKLYEELLINKERSNSTRHPKIFSGREPMIPWATLQPNLNNLLNEAKNNNSSAVIKQLKIIVPEFKTLCDQSEFTLPTRTNKNLFLTQSS